MNTYKVMCTTLDFFYDKIAYNKRTTEEIETIKLLLFYYYFCFKLFSCKVFFTQVQ